MIQIDEQKDKLKFEGSSDLLMGQTLVIIEHLMKELEPINQLIFVAQINKCTGECIFNQANKED